MSNLRIDILEKQVTVLNKEVQKLQKDLDTTQKEISDVLGEMQASLQSLAAMAAAGLKGVDARLTAIEPREKREGGVEL